MKTARLYAISLVVVLCLIVTGTTARARDGYDRRVLVINHSSQVITHIYRSRVGTGSWEGVRFYGFISRQSSQRIDFADKSGECKFDLKAVFADEDEVIWRGADVCTEKRWIIENN